MVKTFETVHLLTAERGTGEILSDRKPNGKERPWKTYKRLGTFLYQLYGRAREIDETCISPSAYLALERCCSWLLFRRYVEGSVLKLHKAEFCRHRLCPTCNWRKSLKLFSQMKEVSARLLQDFPGARYLFLTLTVKNCSGAELAQTIDKMNFGFKLLVNAGKTNASAKAVKANLLGYAKAMEIKYDAEKTITPEMYAQRKKYYIERGLKAGSANPNYGMYHPHFHVLLMVKPSFFKGTGYVKQEQWAEIWQDCMKLDYTPQVDIRAIKPNKRATEESVADAAMTAAISETMKYPIKPDSLKTGCGGKHEPAGTRRTSRSGYLPVPRHERATPRYLWRRDTKGAKSTQARRYRERRSGGGGRHADHRKRVRVCAVQLDENGVLRLLKI